ncbi:UNVERIFIED_CONTAM: hypothetical protein HDU68_006826 [Siphonaria sp. JEL0065]|nr:hypothetical protein HDU68_006826 [Siphonaria sp. JEL0065]
MVFGQLLATSVLLAAVNAQTSDCYTLNVGVLQKWGYPNIPADTATTCCTGALAALQQVVCDPTNTYITELHLAGTKIAGQVPAELNLLTRLTTLDISNNRGISLGLSTLAGIPALQSLNIDATGFSGPTIQFNPSLQCTLPSTLCGNPGCVQSTPIAVCPTTVAAGDNNPANFAPPTASPVLYILLGVFGSALLLLSLMCYCCNQRGAVAQRLLTQPTLPTSIDPKQKAAQYASEEVSTSGEMAMITLSRNGIPKRTFSLPETRKLQSKEEAAMDVAARDPFIVANGGSESFPVRRYYAKELGDELSLTDGDSVVLTKVFRDGWAEGVSMRAGGPALFPLACLGGGVPVVLAERLRVARMMARGGQPSTA